jgi:hypothetical protein
MSACTRTAALPSPGVTAPPETDGDIHPEPSPPYVSILVEGTFPHTGHEVIDRYYERVRDDFSSLGERLTEDSVRDGRPYQLIAGYTVEYDTDGIFSVSRYIYCYTGGAHGMTDVFCETFSKRDGRLLHLDDFFSAGRDVYIPRLLEHIYLVIDSSPDEFWTDAKQIVEQVFPYGTFVVTGSGISLIIPEYNIAPFTTGIVRVDIPLSAVEDIFVLPG